MSLAVENIQDKGRLKITGQEKRFFGYPVKIIIEIFKTSKSARPVDDSVSLSTDYYIKNTYHEEQIKTSSRVDAHSIHHFLDRERKGELFRGFTSKL